MPLTPNILTRELFFKYYLDINEYEQFYIIFWQLHTVEGRSHGHIGIRDIQVREALFRKVDITLYRNSRARFRMPTRRIIKVF